MGREAGVTPLPQRAPKVVALIVLMTFVLAGTTGRALAAQTGTAPSAFDAVSTGSFNTVNITTVDTVAPNPVASPTAPPADGSSVQVTKVKLTAGVGTGSDRVYVATVFDRNGDVVKNADLDLGGLGADPDLRVPTVPMKSTDGGNSYSVKVTFPADGDWVLVVRVHSPTQYVDLFTENIAGGGAVPTHEETSNTPSRRAVRAIDPTFYDRYDPSNPNVGTLTDAQAAALAVNGNGHHRVVARADGALVSVHPFDLTNALIAMLHIVGAGAWIMSVLGLVLANRIGHTGSRSEITRFIGMHYSVLALGGLLLVTVTGIQNVVSASPGLTRPRDLLNTTVGTAYLCVFALKMVAVFACFVTTLRIRRLLPTRPQFAAHYRLSSAGAMVNDDEPKPTNLALVYRLAETNAILAASIIGCVAVLGQLHQAIA